VSNVLHFYGTNLQAIEQLMHGYLQKVRMQNRFDQHIFSCDEHEIRPLAHKSKSASRLGRLFRDTCSAFSLEC